MAVSRRQGSPAEGRAAGSGISLIRSEDDGFQSSGRPPDGLTTKFHALVDADALDLPEVQADECRQAVLPKRVMRRKS